MNGVVIDKKWVLVFVCKIKCLYRICVKIDYISYVKFRLALGEDRDKVDRLIILDKESELDEFKNSYPGQKYC